MAKHPRHERVDDPKATENTENAPSLVRDDVPPRSKGFSYLVLEGDWRGLNAGHVVKVDAERLAQLQSDGVQYREATDLDRARAGVF